MTANTEIASRRDKLLTKSVKRSLGVERSFRVYNHYQSTTRDTAARAEVSGGTPVPSDTLQFFVAGKP